MKQKKEAQCVQTIITLDALVHYTGYKKSYIYQLIHKRKIPVNKPPGGKKVFFVKEDIDRWLLSRKLLTVEEIKQTIF